LGRGNFFPPPPPLESSQKCPCSGNNLPKRAATATGLYVHLSGFLRALFPFLSLSLYLYLYVDYCVRLWKESNGERIESSMQLGNVTVTQVRFSRDGTYLAAACPDNIRLHKKYNQDFPPQPHNPTTTTPQPQPQPPPAAGPCGCSYERSHFLE